MADIPGELDKINDIEIAFDASVSEQLLNKFGANINELINLNTADIFLSGSTYNIPLNATRLLVAACGGGGGGGGGGASGPVTGGRGAQGGDGCIVSLQLINVTGGETATIGIGAGGAGAVTGTTNPGNNGSAGGNTTFATPSNGTYIWYGARGGYGNGGFDTELDPIREQRLPPYHTKGGYGYLTTSGSPIAVYFNGGEGLRPGGVTPATLFGGNRMGGGGGASGTFGRGGNGSNSVFTNTSTSPGEDAPATAYGSGGGASGASAGGFNYGKGGDGAPGFMFIIRSFAV